MRVDEVRDFLRRRQVEFTEGEIQHGTQFRCASGDVINVYKTGKVVFQPRGEENDLSRELAASVRDVTVVTRAPAQAKATPPPVATKASPDKQVFIVYGHDIASRDGLELILHRMGLEPIILANLPAGGDTIIEKLESYLGETGKIGFACVLLT